MAMAFFSWTMHYVTLQKKMQTFFKKSKVAQLDWPGISPGLNPIKNVWAVIKKRLQKCDCSTKTKLIEAIIRIFGTMMKKLKIINPS